MATLVRLLSVIMVMVGAGIPAVIEAQTPIPKTPVLPKLPPNLTIRWLDTLTVNPTTVVAGTKITATVKLMRPAVSRMRINLVLSDGIAREEGWYSPNCLMMRNWIDVEPGTDRNSFTISTLVRPPAGIQPTQVGSSKTFTITASYNNGAERVSTTVTVDRLCTGLWG